MIQQQLVSHDLTGIKKKKNAKKGRTEPPLLWKVWKTMNDKWLDEHPFKDVKLDEQNEVIYETAEPSSDLTMPLLRHQKEWLSWALKQEKSEIRGGILADDMGMGKTIEAIALVLAKRELDLMNREPNEPISSPSPGSSKVLPVIKGTLVICPVVAVTHWVNEIDQCTSKGSTKVLVYYGARRGKSVEQFPEYDFVITTYSTAEFEYRKDTMHLYEEVKNVRTGKKSKQFKKKKKEVTEELEDVTRKDISLIHAVKWQRIILDEAHKIKDIDSKTAKAVFALESSYKWALSGTPILSSLEEMRSLVRFLQIVPYSYYLCTQCNCMTLDRSSEGCPNCIHHPFIHFCWWKKYVGKPMKSHGNDYLRKRAKILLKHRVLKSILLRRTKMGRAADLALPPRIVSLRRDCLDIKEQDYYESLYKESQAQFNTYIEENTLMKNFYHLLDVLTRLRQALCHPYLVVYSETATSRGGTTNNNATAEQECGICHEATEDLVVTSCEHIFCQACLLGQVSCSSCSQLLTDDLTSINDVHDQLNKTTIKGFRSSSILNRIQSKNFQTSTKIEALREEIRFMIERDGSAKGIVFSQFTSFLDLIDYSLNKSGVSCIQLNGSMSLPARDAAIKRFTDDPDYKIFLVTLKAGGVALNLTVASHSGQVFFMDPWWNSAVERQAQDRIHRIGQNKPIRIVRFVIENTIEERLLKLQEKREVVFEGTIGDSFEDLEKLTVEDFTFLFQ
ncbi:PREDICTED: ATP-dependent helicase rhp16-like isoform X1 [Lupinus angustifolius]|uniref:ATP-dependent helicase rhp16-like isoform X1 n=1 Tax=Lupinus angustifolius TaxID=3871 RepID=UPI00092F3CC7|nr:PREDICTED: ATP-dependent helicase rhp16-like isoform X1 [Lupinus angustifolius]